MTETATRTPTSMEATREVKDAVQGLVQQRTDLIEANRSGQLPSSTGLDGVSITKQSIHAADPRSRVADVNFVHRPGEGTAVNGSLTLTQEDGGAEYHRFDVGVDGAAEHTVTQFDANGPVAGERVEDAQRTAAMLQQVAAEVGRTASAHGVDRGPSL